MLADLPAHSLTALDLEFQLSIGADGRALSALLARLSSLQQLRLSTVDGCVSIPGSCVAGIASLSQLTQLELAGSWKEVGEPLQQQLQQPLPLRRLKLRLPLPPRLNMSSLTSLQEFEMSSELRQGSVLPAQLQRLRLHDCSATSGVTALQQLQQLSLGVHFEDREQLLGLAQLPRLRLLALNYSAAAPAAATAPAWQQLPQLQELSVVFQYVDFPRAQQMEGILAGIMACTQLTKLELAVGHKLGGQAADGAADDDADAGRVFPIAVCDSLADLARLRSLTIPMPSWMVPADALALTALTALTHLDLSGAGNGVDDLVASALACSLKQLRHLDLTFCQLEHMACMAAISHLSELTFLGLIRVGEAYERALMQLTNLPCLQRLSLSQDVGVSEDVIGGIYAAMRQRRR
uniref:Uncharacterized protein n=1 Tax=Tetradesmus obliquus TaxID=3088 RepID=A0A383WPB8_TETOB|eukprot:jgi/Sobl393_1/5252/SZX79052.1